jgi:hypothetical protein
MTEAITTSSTTLKITFDRNIDPSSGQNIDNYAFLEVVPTVGDFVFEDYLGHTINPWADFNALGFLSPITPAMAENLRAIRDNGQDSSAGHGRPRSGAVAYIGDSITNSAAYISASFAWGLAENTTGFTIGSERSLNPPYYEDPLNPPPAGSLAEWMQSQDYYHFSAYNKGPANGCESGWTVASSQDYGHADVAVSNVNPRACSIMLGTNDVSQIRNNNTMRTSWKASYKAYVQEYINLGVVPFLVTIPPRSDLIGTNLVEDTNRSIKEVANELHIPYVDFYAAIKHYQPNDGPVNAPGSWFGGFLDANDVPHPSGRNVQNYTQDVLASDNSSGQAGGYALYSMLSFEMFQKIRKIVFENQSPEGAIQQGTSFTPLSVSVTGTVAMVSVATADSFVNGQEYQLTANGIQLFGGGSPSVDDTISFFGDSSTYVDSPSMGLLKSEFQAQTKAPGK